MCSILPFLLLGTLVLVIIGRLVLGNSLFGPANPIYWVVGVTIALYFIEGVIIGAIAGYKLLPRHTKMESMDRGETWMIDSKNKKVK